MTKADQTKRVELLRNAITYLHVVADTIPHNASIHRHISNLNKLVVELMSEQTVEQ